MRALVIAVLLFAVSFADLEVSSVGIEITLNKDGTATVVERVNVNMDTELDVVDYNKAAEINTFQNWIKTLNNPNVRLHVDPSRAAIKDLNIRPQPVKTALGDQFTATILITYKVDKEGGEPLFLEEVVKPRVVKYSLNEKLLSFERTASGNIVLNKGLVLIVNMPKDSVVLDINPLPKNLKDVSLPQHIDQVYWRDQILVGFRLEVMVEESITEEISKSFDGFIQNMSDFLATSEGKIYALMVLFIIGSYLYFVSKVRGVYGEVE